MKALRTLPLATVLSLCALFLTLSCGSADRTSGDGTTNPDLPFTAIAPAIPLTSVPLQDYLVYSNALSSDYIDTLRSDLAVFDNWNGAMTGAEKATLQSLLGIQDATPSTLSMWFKERMKYIVANDLGLYKLGLVFGSQKQVGLQVLGSSSNTDPANTGGGNMGSAIYLTTLDEQKSRPELSYLILRINDEWVPVLSPRAGLMRVGPALFSNEFQINHTNIQALSNSLQRLEVLFHEARHSDGNRAANSVGFSHINCPNDGSVPAELVGVPACDDTVNGAYSVGAAVLKPLLHLCDAHCTAQEQTILRGIYLDRLSRVIPAANGTMKTLDPTPETGFNGIDISTFQAFNLR
ncbi:MAG: hypothetical protein H7249_20615 [Chitinophagaceae bacterium]|nr:hypothetical protein [Oligoflexus sp.]